MPALSSFDYAIIRVVPRVEREEFLNVGVILYCRERRYLAARVELDRRRLQALAPEADVEMIQAALDLIPRLCAGGPEAGLLGNLSQSQRFQWLVAASSTTVEASPVHSGLTADPQSTLNQIFDEMVR